MSRQRLRSRTRRGYAELHALIDAAFDASDVEVFLDRVMRASCGFAISRAILERGLLGKEANALYTALPVSTRD